MPWILESAKAGLSKHRCKNLCRYWQRESLFSPHKQNHSNSGEENRVVPCFSPNYNINSASQMG